METKPMIKINGTDTFTCNYNMGVRQGENLSLFLYLLYINDVIILRMTCFYKKKGIVSLQCLQCN